MTLYWNQQCSSVTIAAIIIIIIIIITHTKIIIISSPDSQSLKLSGGPCASLMDDCVRSRIVPFGFPAYHYHHYHHLTIIIIVIIIIVVEIDIARFHCPSAVN